jgi:hypothetical protein
MQHEQLIRPKSQQRIGPAIVVAEFNFKRIGRVQFQTRKMRRTSFPEMRCVPFFGSRRIGRRDRHCGRPHEIGVQNLEVMAGGHP